MAITAKKINHLGRTVAITWTDADGVGHSLALSTGDDAEILAALGSDTVIVAADPPSLIYSGNATINARIRTTNATPTEVWRATLAQVTLYDANLRLRAVDAGSGACRRIHAEIMAKRLGAGALLVGSPVVIADQGDAATSTWLITAAVSGNDFVVTATGAAGRTIDWLLSGSVESFTPGGV